MDSLILLLEIREINGKDKVLLLREKKLKLTAK